MTTYTLNVNGKTQTVDVDGAMPLLWVLRDKLDLKGTKFGCGVAMCGACTVHLDGEVARACVTPVSSVGAKRVTTIEAIGETKTGQAVQKAWLDVDVMQCGYCQAGQVMAATALINKNPNYSHYYAFWQLLCFASHMRDSSQ
jgi:isoquinoline 1-oxidoreductase alpha subunit